MWKTIKHLVWRTLKRFSDIHNDGTGSPSWLRYASTATIVTILSFYGYAKIKDVQNADIRPGEQIVIIALLTAKVAQKTLAEKKSTTGEIEENEDAPTDGKNSQDS